MSKKNRKAEYLIGIKYTEEQKIKKQNEDFLKSVWLYELFN